ncbi:MAG: hypothetical protein HFI05_12190 [Lachnospiraceae bacterium]|jgi:hypothetical protein|nr:hypothetical protein [Lachnospiraceae bacterium]
MGVYIFYGVYCFWVMWEAGRCTSTYFPYKKWKKYYVIENEFLRKICIRNRPNGLCNVRDRNKLRQPAFIIYTILIPIALVCYMIDIVFQLMVNNEMRMFRSIIWLIGLAAFLTIILIVMIDAILTEKKDKRFF